MVTSVFPRYIAGNSCEAYLIPGIDRVAVSFLTLNDIAGPLEAP